MQLTTQADYASATSVLERPTSGAVLQVHGGNQGGRQFDLDAAKCRIGSSSECEIHLSDQGVRPVHCVLFVGPAGIAARNWSRATRLNDREFQDAQLAVGDRLQISDVEIEVLSISKAASETRGDFLPEACPLPQSEGSNRESEIAELRRAMESIQARLAELDGALSDERLISDETETPSTPASLDSGEGDHADDEGSVSAPEERAVEDAIRYVQEATRATDAERLDEPFTLEPKVEGCSETSDAIVAEEQERRLEAHRSQDEGEEDRRLAPCRSEDEIDLDSDEAMQRYMERLLGRFGGSAASMAAEPAEERSDAPTLEGSEFEPQDNALDATLANPMDAAASSASEPEASVDAVLATPPTRRPRANTTIPKTDLDAMRALAKVATKSDLLEFDIKQHKKLAIDKLVVMGVCFPSGILLAYLAFRNGFGIGYISASIAFFSAALWGAQALRFMAKLGISRIRKARLDAKA